jgi:hypothetical protein
MADYCVSFFNSLLSPYGKPFKCLQRVITVSSAKGTEQALEKAKREFERLEGVPNWKCHAQFLEVESRDVVRE